MARNKVQFQRGLSEPEFGRLHGTQANVARSSSHRAGRKALCARDVAALSTAY